MKPLRSSLLFIMLGYVALGFGLFGCEPDDEKKEKVHLAPDAVDVNYLFVYPVEEGQLAALEPTVRVGFVSDQMLPIDITVDESSAGCFGVSQTTTYTDYYFDDADYTVLQNADVRINGTRLVFRDDLSHLPDDNFREAFATFSTPDGTLPGHEPGDWLDWSIEVDGYSITSDYPVGDVRLPLIGEPELAENGTIIHPSEAIPLDQDVPGNLYYYYLFDSRNFDREVSESHVEGGRPARSDQNIHVPNTVHSDTLWLVCHQYFLFDEPSFQGETGIIAGGMYQWVRTLVVEQE